MSNRDPQIILTDMLAGVQKILSYTADMDYNAFLADSKTADAVLRNLTVLGEGARNVPTSFKEENPEIEWDKIAKSRHIIVHDYFDVDYQIVWKIVTNYLPPLEQQLRRLVATEQ